MINPAQLEEAFSKFTKDFHNAAPDGVIAVNLSVLNELGLLSQQQFEQPSSDNLMHCFHVVETPDKVTLFNEQFAVWIVPKTAENTTSTLTFIALLHKDQPHLEIVFSTVGVYNTPKYILQVLQHFLSEVIDTEQTISSIDKNKKPPAP